jgi:hypothetical protein
MHISDLSELRSLYQKAQPSPLPLPDSYIPIMKVKSGVGLEEIKAEQTVRQTSFEEHMKIVEEVKWDEPLIEPLKKLDE